jgi:predicted nucleic acid-binding Zn ribbon protein
MPTYVYKFIDTGETIEVQQAFSEESLTHAHHPATGEKRPVKKVFTPVGVSFRGGGFYKTDSRGGKSKSTSASTTPASESSSGESTSSSTPSSNGSGGAEKTSTPVNSTPAKAPTSTD